MFVFHTKAAYNALLGREWIHSNWVIPSSLHQSLMFWNDDDFVEMVKVDNTPFEACNNTIDAQLYNKNIGILKLTGFDYNGKPTRVEMVGEEPCSAGEDVTDQEIGKEWFDDNIVEPQLPNIVDS